MSIAFETSGNTESRFMHGRSCISIYDSQHKGNLFHEDHRFPPDESDSSSSSSIGRDSDASGGGSSDGEENEVQSSFNNMDDLEKVLPIKRGISKFYQGKSKSFTSLACVTSVSSVKEIAKPEDPYTRKRKNLLAHSNFWEKDNNLTVRKNGVITRRSTNCSLNKLLPENNNTGKNSGSMTSSPSFCLPPLHPQGKRLPNNVLSLPQAQQSAPWRSLSLSDLQSVSTAPPDITELANGMGSRTTKCTDA